MSRRAFTVEEANAILPRLEEVFEEIARLRDEARERHEKLQLLDALWGEEVKEPGNPDHEEFVDHRDAILDAGREVEERVEEEILGRGIRFPTGGLEHGLVDFPTTWKGRWVYLCWRVGEPEIVAWHEVDGGFRGRRSLTDEQRRRMGREDDPSDVDDSVLDF